MTVDQISKNMNPRVLLVTNDFGPRAGGIETFVIGLLERAKNFEIVLYTSFQEGHESYDQRWLDLHGVEVIRDKSKILLPSPRVIRNLRRLIRERGTEVIWFGAAAPLGLAARWLRIATVRRIIGLTHGHEVWWSKVPPFSLLMREIGKNIDYLGHLGDFTGAAIERVVSSHKLVRIAPGIDTKHFRPNPTTKNRPTIISVGRLVHRKGQDRLVEALPLILKEIPDAELIFVGEGPHREELDRLIKKNRVEENVRFLGRIAYEDLPNYIALGDIFAMPSRSRLFGLEVEGLGIVYLEASSCGLPVIAGSSGGAPDAVIDGETGYVVDGNNVEDIAARCIELLKDESLRKGMGVRGRKWVESEWSWEIWSDKFNELLRK
jgi:phosphatidylinositol alpha-1,6-mannosyltransferase